MEDILVAVFVVLFVITWLMAMSYVFILGRFFNEVKQKEPDTWQTIGRPGLLDMMFLPFLRFHKYTRFLPYLIERKNNPSLGYRWAAPTYYLLLGGLSMFVVLVLVGIPLAVVVGT